MDIWVIGTDGLLGRTVRGVLEARGDAVHDDPIAWGKVPDAVGDLRATGQAYAGVTDEPVIMWCAGAGTPSSPQELFDVEQDTFTHFLAMLEDVFSAEQLAALRFFYPSSGGAVYAGVEAPPYFEDSPTKPLAPYGHNKLRMEGYVREFVAKHHCRGVAGRMSNLYGPGQNPLKAQGLVSAMLRSLISGEPVRIYVPMTTTRDYLFVEDAAKLAVACVDELAEHEPGTFAVKIFASGHAVTIQQLGEAVTRATGRDLSLDQVYSPASRVQAHDLTMRSVLWTHLDGHSISLDDGIRRTWDDLNQAS